MNRCYDRLVERLPPRISLLPLGLCLLWTGCHLVFPFEQGQKTDNANVQVLDLQGPSHDQPQPSSDGAVQRDAPLEDQQGLDGIKPKPDVALQADVKLPVPDLQVADTQQPQDTQQPPQDTQQPPQDTQQPQDTQPPSDTQPPPDIQPPPDAQQPVDGHSLPDLQLSKDQYTLPTCAGPAGIKCAPGEVCDVHSCIANDIGWCKPKTNICPSIYAPVCGCNGKTYPNDCERLKAGVALDHTGPC